MIIVSRFLLTLLTGKFASSIAFWPFILVRDKTRSTDPILLNHEKIHLRQQLELLLVFFYIWYAAEYILNWLKGMNSRQAYRMIRFEVEAYRHESDLNYLKHRKAYSFLHFA